MKQRVSIGATPQILVVTSLRAAILVFLIGFSVANLLALKWRVDRLQLSPLPTASAVAATLAQPDWDSWAAAIGETPGPTPTPVASAAVEQRLRSNREERDRTLAPFYDLAWTREAIIITVAGIAWFALGPKRRSA